MFCKGLNWISHMVLNQQLTEYQYVDFVEWFDLTLWYPTNYIEMKEKGWHKEYSEDNKYVSKKYNKINYELYKAIYKDYPKKEELLKYVQKKFIEYGLDVDKATEQLCEMLSINTNKTITIDGKEIKISSESYDELRKNLL